MQLTHEDILERYICSLQRGEVFDWSQVPDDAELLCSLKLARGLWAESQSAVASAKRPKWERVLATSSVKTPTSRPSFWKSFQMFGAWRIAAVSMAAVFGVVVLVSATTQPEASGSRSNRIAAVWNRVTQSDRPSSVEESVGTTPNANRNVNSETVADADTPATDSGFVPDPADATLTNNENPSAGITSRNGGALVTTLDVVDLDPEDNMNQLIKDFSDDFYEMTDDVTDDGLKDLSSDIVLVNF